MSPLKKINPLFKSFGSKWSSAKHFPKPFSGSTIFEPFAGSAGYSLNYADHNVVLWEINPLLQELWFWLINEARSVDVLDIPLNVPEGTDIRTLGLSRGQQLLLKNWQRTNNIGNCWTISAWGNKPGQWVKSTRDRVADEIHAVKHWQLRPIDWTEQGTYFCDSPYYYNYKYGIKDFDFVAYAANVGKVPPGSLVICCEAVCPKTQAIPDYLPFQPSHSQVTSRRKASNNHHSKELVYVRYT